MCAERELSMDLKILVSEGDTDLALVRPSTELLIVANLEEIPEVLAAKELTI